MRTSGTSVVLAYAAAVGGGTMGGVCAEITYGIDQGACTCEYADSDAAVVESATSGKTIAWAQNAGVPSEMAALSNGLLHLIRIRVPAITLSTVLGKRKATTMTPHHEEVDVKRMLRSLPTGAVAADAWSAIVDGSQNRTESSVLSLLSSKRNTRTAKRFSKELDVYLSGCTGAASEGFIQSAMQLCISGRSELKAWDAVGMLLRTGGVSEHACDGMVDAILRNQQALCAYECLSYVPDLTEESIVRIAQFACASTSKKSLAKLGDDLNKRASSEGKAMLAMLSQGLSSYERGVLVMLLGVFSAFKNDSILRGALQRLSTAQVEVILQALRRILDADKLESVPAKGQRLMEKFKPLLVPALSNTLDWIGLLFDAHFQALIRRARSEDGTASLLRALHESCFADLKSCEILEAALPKVRECSRKKEDKRQPKQRVPMVSYKLESIHLPL